MMAAPMVRQSAAGGQGALHDQARGQVQLLFHNQKAALGDAGQAILLEQLRDKTNNQSFLPYYQPILDTKTNLISGLQIFLRWKNPDNELIAASEIIALLESGSMIVDISLTLLEQIFRQVDLWRTQDLWREISRSISPLACGSWNTHRLPSIEALLHKYSIQAETLVLPFTPKRCRKSTTP